MANTSIGGLVSGLDTAMIISQLMQIEAQPQTRLKSKVTTEQSALTALQALNTKLSSLATKAAELARAGDWTPSTASSSSASATAVAAAGAIPGAVTFTVGQTATRSQAIFTDAHAATAVGAAPAGTTFSLTYADGRSAIIETGDGSLQAMTAAINGATIDGADAGFDAVLVRAGGTAEAPTYRLMVSTSGTGEASQFSVSDNSILGDATITGGLDATISINGDAIRSATNTFGGLMPGVDVTLAAGAKANDVVIVTVSRDAASLGERVKGIVDALNAALNDITTITAQGVNGAKGGVVAGDATLRQVRDQILSSITGGVGDRSLAEVGIEVDRYGKVELDAEKFAAAYAADPAGTEAMFVDTDGAGADAGFGTALEGLAKRLSSPTDGVVTSLVKGRTSRIDGLKDAIDGWDVRLEARRTALERQYAALEVALGKLQSQSSWLAGQIGSLPTMSSGS